MHFIQLLHAGPLAWSYKTVCKVNAIVAK